jgi:predicted amidohydrolase
LVTKVWKNSLPARALDNRVFFALSNRIGTEKINYEELYFTGCSSFYDTNGNLLAQLAEEESGELNISFEHILARDKTINKYNNIFVDRRIDLY